jgi:hypothetical protein
MNVLLDSTEIRDLPDVPDVPDANGAPNGAPVTAPRETVRLADLKAPSRDDGRELICDRFLCRAGSLLFVGPTGAGKSSAAMQAGILWSVGKPFFGLRPSAPLSVLYVQAENDPGDLYEIRNGIYEGLKIAPSDVRTAGNNVRIATVNDAVGDIFLTSVLRPLLAEHRPDLLILDPLLAYIGGDVTRQDVTAKFVRSGLQPAIAEADCGLLLVHHPPKPRKDGGENKSGDDAYFGAGSADLANWARAVIVLKPTTHHGIYELRLAKRGQRARWVEADGVTPSFERTIAHGKSGLIYWRDVEDGEQFRATPNDSAAGDLLAFVPSTGSILKSAWLEKARVKSIGEKRAERILETLESEHRVYIWRFPRPKSRPALALAREPQPGGET